VRLSCEILGVPVVAHGSVSAVLIEIGGDTCSMAEICTLAISRAEISGTVDVGGYVFDAAALGALRQLAVAAYLAAYAEWSCEPAFPPPGLVPTLRRIKPA
jgi:hypothetical protein